jgi:hypothetical protein
VSWTSVVSRNKNKKKLKELHVNGRNIPVAIKKSKEVSDLLKKKIPETAAVSMTCSKDDYNYSSAMKKAKAEIELESCGISEVSVKRSITGGIIF